MPRRVRQGQPRTDDMCGTCSCRPWTNRQSRLSSCSVIPCSVLLCRTRLTNISTLPDACRTCGLWLSSTRPAPNACGKRGNDCDIRQIEHDADHECRAVGPELVVKIAGEPPTKRHAADIGKKPDRNAPGRLACWEHVAQHHDVRRDDAAEAEAECGSNRKK